MEAIINETPDAPAEKATEKKVGWREYLETEEAVRFIYLVFGFCAILMVMIFLQKQTDAICCGDWDGYYHIKWSGLLWENFRHGRWLPTFEWLPLTVLNSRARRRLAARPLAPRSRQAFPPAAGSRPAPGVATSRSVPRRQDCRSVEPPVCRALLSRFCRRFRSFPR